jgi:hypothetical protein
MIDAEVIKIFYVSPQCNPRILILCELNPASFNACIMPFYEIIK